MNLADEYFKQVKDKLLRTNITDFVIVKETLSIWDINVVRYCIFLALVVFMLIWFAKFLSKDRKSKKLTEKAVDPSQYRASCDLAKTCFTSEQTETVINTVEKQKVNVNTPVSYCGLTLFLCSCLSGNKKLINFMLSKGGNVTSRTSAGDTALYLATFSVIHAGKADSSVLEELILAGCDVNKANAGGYTPLHRAAGGGNIEIIKLLMKYGANPYKFSVEGIYPVDIAVNNGHLEAAELLQIRVYNPHVWDVIEPHTPPHIKMGLQSPKKNHLIESSRQFCSPKLRGKV